MSSIVTCLAYRVDRELVKVISCLRGYLVLYFSWLLIFSPRSSAKSVVVLPFYFLTVVPRMVLFPHSLPTNHSREPDLFCKKCVQDWDILGYSKVSNLPMASVLNEEAAVEAQGRDE